MTVGVVVVVAVMELRNRELILPIRILRDA